MVLTGAQHLHRHHDHLAGATLEIQSVGTVGVTATTNNGALIFNSTGAVVYGGVISSSGTVEQSGAGTVDAHGANTYTGATTIDSGTTLQIATPAAPWSSKTVTDNGTLVFNSSAA